MRGREEQDLAAGGAGSRTLILADGTQVSASLAVFKAKHGCQFYAYLRFKTSGKNTKKYVGNVSADTRTESLKLGWDLVRNKRVIEAFGWSWEAPKRRRETAK